MAARSARRSRRGAADEPVEAHGAMLIMALAAATLFAIPPDGNVDPTITRSYKSDVIRARAGTEKRASLRSSPIRTLTYTALFVNQDEANDFRLAWLAAAERLRFLVPLWPEYAIPTAFPTTSTIAGDFTNRDFVQGQQVIVYQDRLTFETATIETLAGSLLTLSAPLAGTYVPLAARVIPIVPMWLDPPGMTMLETAAESVALTFVEEVEGAAAIDSSAGLSASATCANLVVEQVYSNGTGAVGLQFFGWVAHAYDVAGIEIPAASPVWTITPGSLTTATPRFTVSADGREAGLQFNGPDVDQTFDLTVTVGSQTVSIHVDA
jgi:hypothetical protein